MIWRLRAEQPDFLPIKRFFRKLAFLRSSGDLFQSG